jgi:hypothetical protein
VTTVHDLRPLVAHVVYRFDVGGLENGLVNLINYMPSDTYRHVVISLTEITDFRRRIGRDDVQFFALKKAAGTLDLDLSTVVQAVQGLAPGDRAQSQSGRPGGGSSGLGGGCAGAHPWRTRP